MFVFKLIKLILLQKFKRKKSIAIFSSKKVGRVNKWVKKGKLLPHAPFPPLLIPHSDFLSHPLYKQTNIFIYDPKNIKKKDKTLSSAFLSYCDISIFWKGRQKRKRKRKKRMTAEKK